MPPYQRIDIEAEFDALVPQITGVRAHDLLGCLPDFPNADYIFPQEGIVAELKCLQDNKLLDRQVNQKILSLVYEWKRRGHNVMARMNEGKISLYNVPRDLSLAILKVYAAPIKKRIAKANLQIKRTKEELGRSDYSGLLLLANDGNFALDPQHIYAILRHILRHDFSSIDCVSFFTVNMAASSSFTSIDTRVWCNWHRTEPRKVSDAFLDRLSHGWIGHLSSLIGSPIPRIILNSEDDLIGIEHKAPAP